MTDKEALKLALEALEYLATQIKPDYEHNKAIIAVKQALAAPVQEPYGYWWIPDGSVSGLKPGMSPNTGPHPNFTVIPLYTTPPAQPAPVQEPVAWRLWDDEPGQDPRWQYYDKSDFKDGVNPMCVFTQLVALYDTPTAAPVVDCHATGVCVQSGLRAEMPAPVQEPVAWMYQCTADNSGPVLLLHRTNWAESGTGLWTETPLSPAAKRPWVGLTDEEIYDSYNEPRSDSEMVAFARAIEAKLKERNQ